MLLTEGGIEITEKVDSEGNAAMLPVHKTPENKVDIFFYILGSMSNEDQY